MKYLAILLGLFLLVFTAWYLVLPVAYAPGKVESQIANFGPQVASALTHPARFHQTGSGYEAPPNAPSAPAGLKPAEIAAWTAMAQRTAGATGLVVMFPEHYSSGTVVRGQGMSLTLQPLGSNRATAQIENGKLVYHNAYASTDSLQVVSEGRSEEFLLLHDAGAPQRFEYDLSALSGVKDIRLQDGAIHFKNAQGQIMQIEAPWLVETDGKKVDHGVRW
jgi:hypothetical protein